MPVTKSKHAVLTPQDLHEFLEQHCKEARPDLELQEFIQKFDKQHRL